MASRIERIGSPLPMEKLYALWAHPEGGLWISYLHGGATFLHEGRIHNYFANHGLPRNTVVQFAEDDAGGIWAATPRGLMRLEAGEWKSAREGWNVPETYVADALRDRDGTLWIVADEAIYYLRRGARRFEMGMRLGAGGPSPPFLMSSPEGRCWIVRGNLGSIELRTPPPRQMIPTRWRKRGFESADPFSDALIDRDSLLWVVVRNNPGLAVYAEFQLVE